MNTRSILLIILLLIFCQDAAADNTYEPVQFGTYTPEQFREYWYKHGAEISRFSLQQMRYGEIHEGDAFLVFVTEKLNPATQIKAENPGPEDIAVLKLNAGRKFFTGIYPYSILTSVFSPVDVQKFPLPLKITTSTQEWCGNVYMQMNLNKNEYRVRIHSYFEAEGDRDFEIDNAVPEDALWTMARLSPASLPVGEFFIIPGTVYVRLVHRPITPLRAFAKLSSNDDNAGGNHPLVLYEVDFPDEQRTLRIFFEKNFPYRIHSWDETYRGLRGPGAEILTTRATRTHTIMNAYWKHNSNRDRNLLKKLGMKARELGAD
jgi:hypothetical protein